MRKNGHNKMSLILFKAELMRHAFTFEVRGDLLNDKIQRP